MVVHSWKDLPTEIKADTEIVATLPRADQRDLLLVKKIHLEKMTLTKSMRIFSSSPRREYNLTNFLKDHIPCGLERVAFENVRGNIPTRIRKLLESPDVDALIVAKAALDRLLTASQEEFAEVKKLLREYLQQLDWMVLPLTINPNAAAQGALAIEIAANRSDLKDLISSINDPDTYYCAQKEREVLASFGGGCHQKIGVTYLARPYGKIKILKGLTNSGMILDEKVLLKPEQTTKFNADKMWSSDVNASRKPLNDWTLPSDINALFVSRSEAWPDNFSYPHFIWTAGLKTWKNLAQKGVWVHGCSEGMGEKEYTQLDILANAEAHPLKWAKLTHEESGFSEMQVIATYALDIQNNFNTCAGRESFYWNSGSQFLAATKQIPELLNKQHACGPGNTFEIIRQHLEEKNMYVPSRLQIFLDQEDWRQQCTQM